MSGTDDLIAWMGLNFPKIALVAGRFISAMSHAGKLAPEGVATLESSGDALVKLAEHPEMTPARMARLVSILATTLNTPNGAAKVESFLTACESCTDADGSNAGQLPRQFSDKYLSVLLAGTHNDRGPSVYWAFGMAHRITSDHPDAT